MKKRQSVSVFAICSLLLSFASSSRADQPPPATKPAADQAEHASGAEPRRITYRPPRRGAPKERVGGGTRGNDDKFPVIAVLAPEHAGYTTRANVPLIWFISEDSNHEVEVVISRDDLMKPVYESSQKSAKAGFHTLDLAAAGVKLAPGVEYHWNVALILDPSRRAGDVIAAGTVMRVEMEDSMAKQIAAASDTDRVAIYAENGVWYDAIAVLSENIARDPKNASFLEMRSDLLKQVALKEPSEADAKSSQSLGQKPQ